MKPENKAKRRIWLASGLLALFLLAGLLIGRWLNRRRRTIRRSIDGSLEFGGIPTDLHGLSNVEAAARQPEFDLDAEIKAEQRAFFRRAVRSSLLSTFNIDLFGIAIVMLLLDNPGGALGTTLLIVLNLVLNVFQEMFTKRRLDAILKEMRPQAAVIREGQLQSIEPALIVEGDLLVAGRGDEILVAGEVTGEGVMSVESMVEGQDPLWSTARNGDRVYAGDFCVEGRAVYRAAEGGFARHSTAPGSQLQLLLGDMTPLQRLVENVLRALFVLVLVFSVLLVADAWIKDVTIVSTQYRDAFSIIFGIAPTSLFFILIITYAMGTFRISERGALVYKSKTIEALSNIDTLCISKESLVSGVQVAFEPYEQHAAKEPLSENLIRRVLGDIFNSAPILTEFGHMVAQALPGERYRYTEVAPFLFEHGWYGVTFHESELRGTYIIGLPEVLDPNLVSEIDELVESVGQTLSQAQSGLGRWWNRLVRRDVQNRRSDLSSERDFPPVAAVDSSDGENAPGLRQRLRSSLERLLNPMEDAQITDNNYEDPGKAISLLFTYLPDPTPLFNAEHQPQLPNTLIPLSRLHISEVVRIEAGRTIQALVEEGLKVKLLAADSPERSAATVRQLGLLSGDLPMASGQELEGMSDVEFSKAVREATILGSLTPAQKAAVIGSLRQETGDVLMVGSQVSDVPALRQANLRVALRSSTQAALRLTDIVLLEDSLEALPYVLVTGQRLVNGVLDVFKLYLSQVISQLLLILAMIFFKIDEFPYHPTQAGVITAFTIAVPNAFLSIWAAAGRIDGVSIRRRLARFIIPTAFTFALLSLSAYALFFGRTGDVDYTHLAVTYTLLMAGWLRVLFVQPPTPFWVGGAPLRGDRRVIGLVLASILIFLVVISVPLFQELLRVTWLDSLVDYGLVALAAFIWALILRAIWRLRWLEPFFDWIAKRAN